MLLNDDKYMHPQYICPVQRQHPTVVLIRLMHVISLSLWPDHKQVLVHCCTAPWSAQFLHTRCSLEQMGLLTSDLSTVKSTDSTLLVLCLGLL